MTLDSSGAFELKQGMASHFIPGVSQVSPHSLSPPDNTKGKDFLTKDQEPRVLPFPVFSFSWHPLVHSNALSRPVQTADPCCVVGILRHEHSLVEIFQVHFITFSWFTQLLDHLDMHPCQTTKQILAFHLSLRSLWGLHHWEYNYSDGSLSFFHNQSLSVSWRTFPHFGGDGRWHH